MCTACGTCLCVCLGVGQAASARAVLADADVGGKAAEVMREHVVPAVEQVRGRGARTMACVCMQGAHHGLRVHPQEPFEGAVLLACTTTGSAMHNNRFSV